jgi:hypothetical protein
LQVTHRVVDDQIHPQFFPSVGSALNGSKLRGFSMPLPPSFPLSGLGGALSSA